MSYKRLKKIQDRERAIAERERAIDELERRRAQPDGIVTLELPVKVVQKGKPTHV